MITTQRGRLNENRNTFCRLNENLNTSTRHIKTSHIIAFIYLLGIFHISRFIFQVVAVHLEKSASWELPRNSFLTCLLFNSFQECMKSDWNFCNLQGLSLLHCLNKNLPIKVGCCAYLRLFINPHNIFGITFPFGMSCYLKSIRALQRNKNQSILF